MALVDQAIAAKGGLETLRGIRTILAKQTLVNQVPDGQVTSDSTNYIEYPSRFRVETQTPNGIVVQGFDGTQSWMKDSRGVHDAPESVARDARASLRRDTVALLLAAKDGTLTPRALPDVRDASGRVSHALELSARDLNPIILYVDPASGLITKQTFVADAPNRPLVEEEFSDYRAIDGVQVAFRAVRKVGDLNVERRVSEIKINPVVDPSIFKRPAS